METTPWAEEMEENIGDFEWFNNSMWSIPTITTFHSWCGLVPIWVIHTKNTFQTQAPPLHRCQLVSEWKWELHNLPERQQALSTNNHRQKNSYTKISTLLTRECYSHRTKLLHNFFSLFKAAWLLEWKCTYIKNMPWCAFSSGHPKHTASFHYLYLIFTLTQLNLPKMLITEHDKK